MELMRLRHTHFLASGMQGRGVACIASSYLHLASLNEQTPLAIGSLWYEQTLNLHLQGHSKRPVGEIAINMNRTKK